MALTPSVVSRGELGPDADGLAAGVLQVLVCIPGGHHNELDLFALSMAHGDGKLAPGRLRLLGRSGGSGRSLEFMEADYDNKFRWYMGDLDYAGAIRQKIGEASRSPTAVPANSANGISLELTISAPGSNAHTEHLMKVGVHVTIAKEGADEASRSDDPALVIGLTASSGIALAKKHRALLATLLDAKSNANVPTKSVLRWHRGMLNMLEQEEGFGGFMRPRDVVQSFKMLLDDAAGGDSDGSGSGGDGRHQRPPWWHLTLSTLFGQTIVMLQPKTEAAGPALGGSNWRLTPRDLTDYKNMWPLPAGPVVNAKVWTNWRDNLCHTSECVTSAHDYLGATLLHLIAMVRSV